MTKAELRELTGVDLKDKARDLEIQGFSNMNKEELVDAVAKALRKSDKAKTKEAKTEVKAEAKDAKPEPPAKPKTITPGVGRRPKKKIASGPKMKKN